MHRKHGAFKRFAVFTAAFLLQTVPFPTSPAGSGEAGPVGAQTTATQTTATQTIAARTVATWFAGAGSARAAAPVAETAKPAKPADADAADAAAVVRLFNAVRDAAVRGDGKRLTAGLSRDTLIRLEAVRQAARRPNATAGLSPAERLAAGGLRRAATPADLNRKSLDDLASAALTRRRDLGGELRKAGLGPVRVNGDRASAPLLADKQPTLFTADFVRESGAWRLDLRPALKRGDMLLIGMAAMKGGDENALIDAILGQIDARMRPGG